MNAIYLSATRLSCTVLCPKIYLVPVFCNEIAPGRLSYTYVKYIDQGEYSALELNPIF